MQRSLYLRFKESRDLMGMFFMLPIAVMLVCLLAYPLILGIYLGFTGTTTGFCPGRSVVFLFCGTLCLQHDRRGERIK